MAATATKKLYNVTIRRTYTPEYRARWSHTPEHTDSTHPEWAETGDAIVATWAAIHANPTPHFVSMYTDCLLMVEEMDVELEREKAALWPVDPRGRCCDLAVRNPCVCLCSFSCPEHGTRHVGTHD